MSDNCLILGGGEEEKFQSLEDEAGAEDELDAFNDETFGGEGGEWEESAHQELADLTEQERAALKQSEDFFEFGSDDGGDEIGGALEDEPLENGKEIDSIGNASGSLQSLSLQTSSRPSIPSQPLPHQHQPLTIDPAIQSVHTNGGQIQQPQVHLIQGHVLPSHLQPLLPGQSVHTGHADQAYAPQGHVPHGHAPQGHAPQAYTAMVPAHLIHHPILQPAVPPQYQQQTPQHQQLPPQQYQQQPPPQQQQQFPLLPPSHFQQPHPTRPSEQDLLLSRRQPDQDFVDPAIMSMTKLPHHNIPPNMIPYQNVPPPTASYPQPPIQTRPPYPQPAPPQVRSSAFSPPPLHPGLKTMQDVENELLYGVQRQQPPPTLPPPINPLQHNLNYPGMRDRHHQPAHSPQTPPWQEQQKQERHEQQQRHDQQQQQRQEQQSRHEQQQQQMFHEQRQQNQQNRNVQNVQQNRQQNRNQPNPDRFPNNQERFPNNQQERFPNNRDRFPNNQDRFPNNQDRFPNNQDRFPNNQDRFPNNQDRFPNNQDRFPNNQDRFSNNQERFPNNQDRFPNNQDRSNNQDRFPNNQQHGQGSDRGWRWREKYDNHSATRPDLMPGHVHVLGILKHSRSRQEDHGGEGTDFDLEDQTLAINPTGDPLLDLELAREAELAAVRRKETEDEYAGLMSQRDKQWIINIQLSQLKCENPYIDDYYYTVYTARQEAKMAEDMRPGQDGPQLVLNNMDHDIHDKDYIPKQFENSLGKLQCVTVKAPRRIIDVGVVVSQDGPSPVHEGSPAPGAVVGGTVSDLSGETRHYKQVLIEIERLYTLLLESEDDEKMLSALPTGAPLRDQVEEERAARRSSLTTILASSEKLLDFLEVRKGRCMLLRALPLLPEATAIGVYSALLASPHPAMDMFWPPLARHIKLASMTGLLSLASSLSQPEDSNHNKPAGVRPSLASPIAATTIITLIGKAAAAAKNGELADVDSWKGVIVAVLSAVDRGVAVAQLLPPVLVLPALDPILDMDQKQAIAWDVLKAGWKDDVEKLRSS